MTKTGAVLLLFCCSFFIFIFFLTFLLNGVAEWDISYVKMVVSMIAFSVTGVKFRFQLKIQKMKKTEIAPFFYSLFFHFLFFSSFFFPFFFSLPELTVLLQNFFSLLLLLFSSLLALLCYLGWFILFSSLVGAVPIFFFVFCWPMRDCEWMMEWSMMNVEVSTVFL